MLSFITIGITTSLSVGSSIFINIENTEKIIPQLKIMVIGNVIFYLGVFLMFCLFSTKICYINPNETYSWYSGIWHGLFVIPNWIFSFFSDQTYCKAQKYTFAYIVFWWLSFILVCLSILSSNGKNNDDIRQ
jgi:hypothetical protein